jgi:O-phosphoseryl-tRNA(Cys) synthetase
MKIVITEDKRNRLAINMIEEDYPDLKKITFPGHEEIFVSDKGMFKMSYISRTKRLYVLNEIWDFIRSMFGYDNDEVSELLLDWGNKKFGFRAKKCHRVEQI